MPKKTVEGQTANRTKENGRKKKDASDEHHTQTTKSGRTRGDENVAKREGGEIRDKNRSRPKKPF